MNTDAPRLEAFTTGVPTAVDVADIERQLSALWQLAAENPSAPVTRASMGTLVIVCDEETELETATTIARELTASHPCRIIAVCAVPDAPSPALIATITAHCHLGTGGGKQVCSEQITVRATGSAVAQIPSIVESLLEADLPVTTWWMGSWPETGMVRDRLLDVSDRVCVDTSSWSPDQLQPYAIAAVLRAHPHTTFHDLNWIRLAFWRCLTADLFDSPAAMAEVSSVHTIAIQHGTGPGAPWRARLYAAWMQTRLGRRLHTRITPQAAPEAGIIEITIASAHGRFELRKLPDEQAVSMAVHLPQFCELPRNRALWPIDTLSLLRRALDDPQPDADYRRALQELTKP